VKIARIILAVFVAPLLVIPVNALMAGIAYSSALLELSFLGDAAVYSDADTLGAYVYETVHVLSILGVPIAFFTLAVLWAPIYGLIRIYGMDSLLSFITLSFVLTLIVILLLDGYPFALGLLFIVFLFFHGLAVGSGFLWISGIGFPRGRPIVQGAVGNEGDHRAN
jgi:hypothetical protein